jgi:hypothetical protein
MSSAVSTIDQRIAPIQEMFGRFKKFDSALKKELKSFQKSSPLHASQAEKVIALAATTFGKDGAISALEILKNSLIGTNGRGYIYPENQISLLRSLASIQAIDGKTALFLLEELKFYDQRDLYFPRECLQETVDAVGAFSDKELAVSEAMLVEPIQIIGNRYGKSAAIEALELARDHCYMRYKPNFREGIRTYFKNKYGIMTAEEIQPKLTYSLSQKVKDLLFSDDPDSGPPSMEERGEFR